MFHTKYLGQSFFVFSKILILKFLIKYSTSTPTILFITDPFHIFLSLLCLYLIRWYKLPVFEWQLPYLYCLKSVY